MFNGLFDIGPGRSAFQPALLPTCYFLPVDGGNNLPGIKIPVIFDFTALPTISGHCQVLPTTLLRSFLSGPSQHSLGFLLALPHWVCYISSHELPTFILWHFTSPTYLSHFWIHTSDTLFPSLIGYVQIETFPFLPPRPDDFVLPISGNVTC